jgi:serine O-acetyltransferase
MSLTPRLSRDFRRLQTIKGWSTPRALFDALFLDAGFQALVAHRLAHALRRSRVPLLPALLRRWSIGSCGIDILPQADIGGGCYIPHGLGLVVGGNTVIGRDCTLLQGVTLGEADFKSLASPRLGDRVLVGAGAQILGGVTIGDDARIGAGAVVLDDVPAGHTAVGVPARSQPTTGGQPPS